MRYLVIASRNDDSDSLFDGKECVGHLMRTQKSPAGKPWFWTIFVGDTHDGAADRGYAATREEAMAENCWIKANVR